MEDDKGFSYPLVLIVEAFLLDSRQSLSPQAPGLKPAGTNLGGEQAGMRFRGNGHFSLWSLPRNNGANAPVTNRFCRAAENMKLISWRQLTWQPLRAIRAKCLWCSNDQHKEVEVCAASSCLLHPYRMGMGAAPDKVYLIAIRRKCLDCQTGSYVEVERCNSFDCPLWMFRFGGYSSRPGQYGQLGTSEQKS